LITKVEDLKIEADDVSVKFVKLNGKKTTVKKKKKQKLNQIVVDLKNLKKEIETFKKRNIIYEFIMDPESKFSQEVLEKLRAELLDTVPKITKYKSDGWKISKNKNDIVLSNSNIQNQLDARNQKIDETKGKKKKFTEEITCERSKYSKKKGEDVGCWMLDVGRWMLDVGCWMLDVGCWMVDIGRWTLHVGLYKYGARCRH
jgi:septum formation topological specificity factor MinE